MSEQERNGKKRAHAFKLRHGRTGHEGPRWVELIASERLRNRSVQWVMSETIVVTVLVLGALRLAAPADPLLIGSGFGWIWLVPMICSLRYGLMQGVLSSLGLLAGYYLQALPDQRFPLPFFLGGMAMVLVCGQFGDTWGSKLRHLRTMTDYLNERLGVLTKSHFLLRLSHERLEHDLLSRPASLRDSLSQLRALSFQSEGLNQEPDDKLLLAHARRFIEVAAHSCQLERAQLHVCRDGVPDPVPVAGSGAPFELDCQDILLRYALEHRTLAHVQNKQLAPGIKTDYIAVAPLVDAQDEILGVLVVRHMPFMALSEENLQLLLVLSGYYADGVRHGAVAGLLLSVYPSCPHDFALDFSRLVRLYRTAGITSSLVALTFDKRDIGKTLFDHVQLSRRSLDVQWVIPGEARDAILVLMPLSGESAVEGFLLRIEESMRAQFGVDLESGHVSVNTMPLPVEAPTQGLAAFLRRCQIHV
ncbi:PelD GGDEF domain-containing protein [Paludibacterium purpuratum]|uniref:GAF domain-containing protein n=1 Tax=Paludibacterium purpuratum TaxID=1144873 RepID=A0A4R7AZE9_9NEIS|nr:PelD GGDEF domain-containing protein [Paludibacterium purpuratum]TDR73617.1 GAF domain-containing protein [Paludibacterium purpuratum]